MSSQKTKMLVMAALMAAMTYIATTTTQIPSPIVGYIHLGDGFVLLSGIILGPIYGGLAAGIGSMFADLLTPGFASYAPATFIIKALAAITGGLVYHTLIAKLTHRLKLVPIICAGICGGTIVTGGYLLYEALFLGLGFTALGNVPFNVAQNIFGIIVSTALVPILVKTPIREIMFHDKKALN